MCYFYLLMLNYIYIYIACQHVVFWQKKACSWSLNFLMSLGFFSWSTSHPRNAIASLGAMAAGYKDAADTSAKYSETMQLGEIHPGNPWKINIEPEKMMVWKMILNLFQGVWNLRFHVNLMGCTVFFFFFWGGGGRSGDPRDLRISKSYPRYTSTITKDEYIPWKMIRWWCWFIHPKMTWEYMRYLEIPPKVGEDDVSLDQIWDPSPWGWEGAPWWYHWTDLSRWWFQILFIFTLLGGRFPFWLIFFKWVGSTTN